MLEGQEPAPLFFDKAFGKYHCMVEAGFNTESQKQMSFAQKLQLRELGVNIPDKYLIEDAMIQNKDVMLQQMEQEKQEGMQMQQSQAQAQMQETQARAELAQARAYADKGLGIERISRVEENRAMAVKQMAEANKEDEMAVLNKIKILKEIEDIDIGHLQKLMAIATALKTSEQQGKENPSGSTKSTNPRG
jgi:hypothetical protein